MSVNNDKFLLEDSDLEKVRNICKYINNEDIRERAVANCLSAEIVSKYFVDTEVDTSSGIHNVPEVLGDIEISDIYINNNYIDVRLYFNENELCVPKSHYDLDIAPVAYMFVKVDNSLSNCSVAGFLSSESVDKTVDNAGYYRVNAQDLVSFQEIEQLLGLINDEGYPDAFSRDVFDYLDKKLSNKKDFYKVLIKSRSAREYLINASKAKCTFNFISVNSQFESENAPETSILEPEDNLLEEPLINDSL